jgi:lysophospholipase L1-like esterase
MSARGRVLSYLATAVIALGGFVTVGAIPAAGASSRIVEYVALGDSYAAGLGAGPPYNGACLQSAEGYPALLESERIDLETNAICSGATTSEVAKTQLSELSRDTRLVTITVGGNDLGVSHVASVCTTEVLDNCLAAIQEARDGLSMLGSKSRSPV